MKFKTNLKCDGCVATVTPILDQAVGADHWQVDLNDPLRLLIIDSPKVTPPQVQKMLADLGFQAELVSIA